jgi:hypothetical protein
MFGQWRTAFARRDLGRAARIRRDLLRLGYAIGAGSNPRLTRLVKGVDR